MPHSRGGGASRDGGRSDRAVVGFVVIFGGPSIIDTSESLYGTWAVSHGQLACAYPSVSLPHFPPIAPLYLLLSGAFAASFRAGHSVAFPSTAALDHTATGPSPP